MKPGEKKTKEVIGKKAKFDPSKDKREKREKEESTEKKTEDKDLDVLAGYGPFKDTLLTFVDGKKYTMAPYILKDYREALRLVKKLNNLSKIDSQEVVDITIGLIYLSLKRHHPNITKKYIEDNVDLNVSRQAMAKVFEFMGLTMVLPEKKNVN